MKIPVYYVSIEGNTKHFLTKMSQIFHNVDLHQADNQTDLFKINHPYFVFVPAYATYEDHQKKCVELPQTFPMTEELAWQKNYKYCLGSVGSGNRNFSQDQWIWTAKLYRKMFNIPIIASYELRGNMYEENVINQRMVRIWNQNTKPNQHVKEVNVHHVNPRLAKLEKKYGRNLQGERM